MGRTKPFLQAALFNLENPPVKPVALVEVSLPPVTAEAPQVACSEVTQEEKAACKALWGQEIAEKTCPHCGKAYLLATYHESRCPMDWSTQQPKAPSVSVAPVLGAEWIGRPLPCPVCGEVVPTLRHLDLIHDSHGEGLRGRLLTAYLWPAHRERAERLELSVAELRRLIMTGGFPQSEKWLLEKEGTQREYSAQANDPPTLNYPYKQKGMADGDKMAPQRWRST